MKRFIALLLVIVFVLSLAGCAQGEPERIASRRDLPEEDPQNPGSSSGVKPDEKPMDAASAKAYNAFAFKMFQEVYAQREDTVMVSPYSLYIALCLLTNGADGDTLTELENVLGLKLSDLNGYFGAYDREMTGIEEFSSANSIWIAERIAKIVKEEYIKNCADYYRSAVYNVDFVKSETLERINAWASEKTNGLIPKAIDSLDDPETVAMILMNAVLFDGKWKNAFSEDRIFEQDFTHENGSVTKERLMYGTADDIYLENDFCTGFMKNYEGRFSYIGLLPKEGVSVKDLVASMNAESYQQLLDTRKHGDVYICIPEYKTESSVKLVDPMKKMGIQKAFDINYANFNGITGKDKLYVSDVFQKTFIEVSAEGTKAAAVTVITVRDEACSIDETPSYNVYLDRSFVYMIVDNETGCPVFTGVVR
ncbi:MAG: serpin family protein [Lachnospiraceae bacterium]|nr:serpin family protein [Lachnospiraceae bacterium]